MNTLKTSAPPIQTQDSDQADFKNLRQPAFLEAVIEGLIDGILILTDQGEWVHANECARQICSQLTQDTSKPNSVPEVIWCVCKSLIENPIAPNQKIILLEKMITSQSKVFRIRARWLNLEQCGRPCLLLTMEDQSEFVHSMAIADGEKYGLTSREQEVWSLYQANYSYKEIADELYISMNTVKKHMKNVHAKRLAFKHSHN